MEKNPKEQASDSSEETYENESSPNEQDVSHSEGKSIAKKQKILLVANDLAIRRMARQIQQEKIRLARLQEERDEETEAKKILSDPLIIYSSL